MNNLSYLQVGLTVECGNCHPEKFPNCADLEKEFFIKCKCICHDISCPDCGFEARNGHSLECSKDKDATEK